LLKTKKRNMRNLIYIKCVVVKKRQYMNEAGKDLSNSYDTIKSNVTHEVTTNNCRK
jgi:hypothetical protein